MSSTSRAWIAAASVGAVEVLKDQGFARWNYTLRSIHQHAKNNLRSFSSQATKLTAASVKSESDKMRDIKMKQSEESLRKVMTESIRPRILSYGPSQPMVDGLSACVSTANYEPSSMDADSISWLSELKHLVK
ncbi:Protein of unknown function wound-induced [Dillenia turbinata]|uniref:Uncharacterized protein n=1 Tax=Dillenia turbinata TaxID=194707 RepID=A0AAN8VME3_9MAGN